MGHIENYEDFCIAFQSENESEKNDAALLLMIQNWIINIINSSEDDILDYSLDKLLEQIQEQKAIIEKKDSLSAILDYSIISFHRLVESMHEKIVREHVRMPSYKAKEIDGYSINWLSKQTGKTIKQKISSTGNSIMAVQRRMSFDTAENRLLLAFVKEMRDILNLKFDYLPEALIRREEEEFLGELSSFLNRDDIDEIGRWENTPPNNTLLSDQNYKKIWRAWNELKKIDERIKNDSEGIAERVSCVFFIEILSCLRRSLKIPQVPVEVDYDTYRIYIESKEILCLDYDNQQWILNKKGNIVSLESKYINVKAEFENDTIKLAVNDKCVKDFKLSIHGFNTCIKLFVSKSGIKLYPIDIVNNSNCCEEKIYKNVIIDLFSLYPDYIGDSELNVLSERIMQQKITGIDIDGDTRNYYISCDKSNAIKMITGKTQTYTVPFAVDSADMQQMKRLLQLVSDHIRTESFTYIFPDAYNELQLSMVHSAAKIAYGKVRNIPLSIGAAFDYQDTDDFKSNFNTGDYLLFLNLIDDEITMTLLLGGYDEKVKIDIPEYKGVVWERHPTSTFKITQNIQDFIIDRLLKSGCKKAEKVYRLFGIEGLKKEIGKSSLFFGDSWFDIKEDINSIFSSFKIDITGFVDEFLRKNRSIIKHSPVHLISFIDSFVYKGRLPYIYKDKIGVLKGCNKLQNIEKRTKNILWHDHLPALAIKMLYGKFDLIKDFRVEPSFDKEKPIPIEKSFVLPKNCKEYHLKLVQDESARKMEYEAVIKNPAFPLKQDTECELKMSYTYGAEEPYKLLFVPKSSENSEFSEAKVQWTKLEHYTINDLKSPEFPRKLSWDELKYFKGRKGDVKNVYQELETQYTLINNGYETYNLSNSKCWKNKLGLRYGEFEHITKSGECITVSWNDNLWEKGTQKPDNLSVVSFIPVEDSKSETEERFRITNLELVRTSRIGNLWFKNKKGSYQCKVNFEYNGEYKTLSIIQNYFDKPDMFHTGVRDISFVVDKFPDGNLFAKKIHDESTPMPKRCFAKGLHAGDSPPKYFINSYFGKWTRTMFANNRSLSEDDCPLEFQKLFVKTVKNWVSLYDQYEDFEDKTELFKFISLAAKDIGKDYYDIATNHIEMYKMGMVTLPPEIGCALCDLSDDMQQSLFESLINEISEDSLLISILSKAIWHNEDFIFKVDLDIILNRCLTKAINIIGGAIKRCKGDRILKGDIENVKMSLEYILGVLRLRSLKDETITDKYLSLNNPEMQNLYKYLEIMADNNTVIFSFLQLEISSKGDYENICDLLYVLLVYVSGYNTEGEIRISGINVDE